LRSWNARIAQEVDLSECEPVDFCPAARKLSRWRSASLRERAVELVDSASADVELSVAAGHHHLIKFSVLTTEQEEPI
jgi:hypothetical protein